MIQRDAILEAVWTTGVFRHVSADGTGRFTRRVGRVQQSMRSDIAVQPEIDDSGLDCRAPILDIECDDFLEAMQTDDDDVVTKGAAGKPRSRAARDERKI